MTSPGIYADPMADALGAVLAWAAADPDLATLTGGRIRAIEPKPVTDDGDAGDARGPKDYVNYVLIAPVDVPPHPSLPVSFADFSVQCFGVTNQGAFEVYRAFVAAFHHVGSRVRPNGLGIYQTLVSSGSGFADRDPDTRQPLVRAVLRVIYATSLIEVAGS